MKFPEQMSKELAELVGIHFGDGSLYKDKKYNYNLTYTGNLSKDGKFIDYVNSLFDMLFQVKLHKLVSKSKNSIGLRIRSKNLFYFFRDTLKVPAGKKEDLLIPYWIKSDKIFLTAFLRGLFDTDGCVVLQKFGKYKYILAKISTQHRDFAYDISKSLSILNIPSFVITKSNKVNNKIFEGYDVVIRNKNVTQFFKIVGSKNPRNIQSFHNKSGDAEI